MRRLTCFVPLLGLCAVAAASPQRAEPPILSVRTDLVTLSVIVVDRRGALVSGLRQEHFTVYDNGELGPVLHIVCKPNGSLWVERKLDPRQYANPWQEIQGSGIRYAASLDGPDWRGEVAIPWSAITNDPMRGRPALVRFNFTQHKTLTGESATWAGPIDYGRDENFTGVLILREPQNPGMRGN